MLTTTAQGHVVVAGGEGNGGGEDRVSGGAAMQRCSGETEASTGSVESQRCRWWRIRGRSVDGVAGIGEGPKLGRRRETLKSEREREIGEKWVGALG